MSPTSLDATRRVPLRALGLSIAALAVPVFGALAFPERLGEAGALLWLVALIPAFLLAYHRGWSGVATALAMGMATLSVTQAVANTLGLEVPDLLFPIVAAYLAISLGIGWVTELLHREKADVESLALTDSLTELPNRRHAMAFLENEFGAAQRGRALCVALFDLDNFKEYNDRYGHQAGDEALARFGEALLSTTRRMNLSARFGGEEFVTILAGSEEEGARIFAERVQEALLLQQPPRGPLTVSAGIAAYQPSMESPADLLKAADSALYRAKAEGRNRVRVFGRPDDAATATEDAFHEAVLEKLRAAGPPEAFNPSSEATRLPTLFLSADPSRAGEGPSALIVENAAPVRELLATFLEGEGFEVVKKPAASEGMRALNRSFDLILVEVATPRAAGKEMISVAKATWPNAQVIALAELRDGGAIAEALDTPADRFLFKPFSAAELRAYLVHAFAPESHPLREHAPAPFELPGEEGALASTILRSLRSLVSVVELREPRSRGHASRVAEYGTALAQAMGNELCDPEELEAFRIACELHDIGKIAIPEAILEKEEHLDGEKQLWMKQHPILGGRILEPFDDVPYLADIAGGHHERWDGSGFPEGLAGEAIPLAARVVAIVDALDRLTVAAPVGGELPWEAAVEEILGRFGSHFDPTLEMEFRQSISQLQGPFRIDQERASPVPS